MSVITCALVISRLPWSKTQKSQIALPQSARGHAHDNRLHQDHKEQSKRAQSRRWYLRTSAWPCRLRPGSRFGTVCRAANLETSLQAQLIPDSKIRDRRGGLYHPTTSW